MRLTSRRNRNPSDQVRVLFKRFCELVNLAPRYLGRRQHFNAEAGEEGAHGSSGGCVAPGAVASFTRRRARTNSVTPKTAAHCWNDRPTPCRWTLTATPAI